MKTKKKILLVEDDQPLQKLYRIALEKADFKVIAASDGHEGLEKANQEKPDLILLDLMLPKIGGLKVLSLLKEDQILKEVPVIVFSALSQKEIILDSLALGAKSFLCKSDILPSDIIKEAKKYLK